MIDNKTTENELISLYQNGEQRAMAVLLERIRPFIIRVVFNYVGDWERTQDYTQDVLIKVKLNIDNNKYLPKGNFYSWLSCITKNYVGDDLRHRKRCGIEGQVSLDKCRELMNNDFDETQERISFESELAYIDEIIRRLPSNQREIIIYRYFQELSFKDIASKLNISINTALGRCRYGIKNLKKLYSYDHCS